MILFLSTSISFSIFIFTLGAIVGSFLNVVILRYNTGRSINGRSGCMHCNYQLRWYDLIPIFSWISLRGRCRKCRAKISLQYPLVEIATGLIFLSLFLKIISEFSLTNSALLYFVWHAFIFSILIVVFVYDLKHKIIPNELSYTFATLALIQTLYLIFQNGFSAQIILGTNNLLNLLIGPILFFFFWALWFVSGGRWLGLGDGKLVLGIGWYLGFVYGLSAIILAFWIGAIIGVLFLLIQRLNQNSKHIKINREIPFAPFLIIGLLIEFFWQIDFVGLNFFLN